MARITFLIISSLSDPVGGIQLIWLLSTTRPLPKHSVLRVLPNRSICMGFLRISLVRQLTKWIAELKQIIEVGARFGLGGSGSSLGIGPWIDFGLFKARLIVKANIVLAMISKLIIYWVTLMRIASDSKITVIIARLVWLELVILSLRLGIACFLLSIVLLPALLDTTTVFVESTAMEVRSACLYSGNLSAFDLFLLNDLLGCCCLVLR